MNKAIIMGRLTRDPELRTTTSNVAVCTFTVAVDRKFKNASGERQADFLPCVAWRQQADFIAKYFQKGSRILVTGTIQTRSFDDKEGNKRNITEIVVDEIDFVDTKTAGQNAGQNKQPADDGFFPGQDDDTALPFDI